MKCTGWNGKAERKLGWKSKVNAEQLARVMVDADIEALQQEGRPWIDQPVLVDRPHTRAVSHARSAQRAQRLAEVSCGAVADRASRRAAPGPRRASETAAQIGDARPSSTQTPLPSRRGARS